MKKTKLRFITVGSAILGTVLMPTLIDLPPAIAQHNSPAPSSSIRGQGQTIVVHLTHTTDDLHSAFMALKLGTGMQKQGAQVILILTLEGARLADKRQPLDLRWGSHPMTLGEAYEQFVAAGGKVMVCPFCAEAAGIGAENLRAGAEFARGDRDIPSLILEADKVMDF